MFAKPTRQTDEDFLEWLRTQSCVTCGAEPRSEPSHLRTVGAGGSDYTACSQCRNCHREIWHRYGPLTAPKIFLERFGVDIWQAQSRQLAAYFSDPVVIIRRAADVVENAGELTPGMKDRFRRLTIALENRREVESVPNA